MEARLPPGAGDTSLPDRRVLRQESGRVAAEAVVVAAVLVLFLAAGTRGSTGHALYTVSLMGGVLVIWWSAHYIWHRLADTIPVWYAWASVAVHGIVVGWHAIALMAPAEPLFTSYLLLIFLALHSLRLSPAVVLFAGGFYAAELTGLGLYFTSHGPLVLIDAHPLGMILPGTLMPLGMVGVRPFLLLAVTACSWWLVRTVDKLLSAQAALFREREDTLARWTRELEQRVEERTIQWQAAVAEQARLAERERIAHRLHDGLSKSVAGLALQLGALAGHARYDPTVGEELGRVADQARKLALDARHTLADIREPLGPFSLVDLLQADARIFHTRTGIDVSVRTTGELPALTDETVQELRCVVGEALDNAARHSTATRLEIELATDNFGLTMVVDDDGQGLSQDLSWRYLAMTQHYGLLGMRERCRRLNGECNIVGHGRLGGLGVQIRIPVPSEPIASSR